MNSFSIAPRIIATVPADNAQNVPLETRIFKVSFNTDLDRSEIENNVSLQTKEGVKLPTILTYDERMITLTLHPEMKLKPATIYSISLRGDGDDGDGFTVGIRNVFGKPMADSTAIYFSSTGEPGIDPPKAITPPDLNALKGIPTFTWNDTGATRYELEVAKENAFDRIHWGNQYATSPATPTHGVEFPDGTYYWRLRGVSAGGVPGEWSRTYIFVVDSLELGPIAPQDTLPPEVEYDSYVQDDYVEFLGSFPKDGATNLKTTLKTMSFQLLGEYQAADIEASLVGESLFGDSEDHGEIEPIIETVVANGATTVYVTVPLWQAK